MRNIRIISRLCLFFNPIQGSFSITPVYLLSYETNTRRCFSFLRTLAIRLSFTYFVFWACLTIVIIDVKFIMVIVIITIRVFPFSRWCWQPIVFFLMFKAILFREDHFILPLSLLHWTIHSILFLILLVYPGSIIILI